jgi:hypothetical protein
VEFPKGLDANAYALKVTPAEKSLGMLRTERRLSVKQRYGRTFQVHGRIVPIAQSAGVSFWSHEFTNRHRAIIDPAPLGAYV